MNYIVKLVKGYFISFILFFILTVLISVLFKFTSIPETLSFYLLIGAFTVATMFLGVFSGYLIGQKGLLWALFFSSIFVFLVVFIVNCVYFKELSSECFNTLYLIPVIFGGIGGIIGVNVKK